MAVPAGFSDWMRRKRRAYASLVAASLLISLLLPLSMHWIDHAMGAGAGWQQVAAIASMQTRFHLPWWLLAWLFPFAFAAAVALAIAAFDAVLYVLRLDPGDHAWSSLCWSLRGWLLMLLWLLLAVCAAAMVAALGNALDAALGRGAIAFAQLPGCLFLLAVLFVGLNPAWLAAPRPSLRLSPRWPGNAPFALLVVLYVAILACIAVREGLPPDWSPGVLALPAAFFLLIALQLVWLGAKPAPDASLARTARQALQPRVFLPRLVLRLRWHALFVLAILPVVPVALFLIFVLPLLEDQLAAYGCCHIAAVMPFVQASRFAIMWWWALLLFALGAFYGLVMPMSWLDTVSSGRLMVELGLVPGVRAQVDQAGEPSGLRSRK